MSAEENKALVRRVIEEAQNQGNAAVVDEIFASTCVVTPLWPNAMRPSSLATVEGVELVKAGSTMMRAALPDAMTTIEAMSAEGDTVIVCTTTKGTHTGGAFFDIAPSGKTVQWITFSIYRIADGKVVEQRWLWDRLGAFQQLGVLPSQDELRQQRQAATR